jgi:hypothetical protein
MFQASIEGFKKIADRVGPHTTNVLLITVDNQGELSVFREGDVHTLLSFTSLAHKELLGNLEAPYLAAIKVSFSAGEKMEELYGIPENVTQIPIQSPPSN